MKNNDDILHGFYLLMVFASVDGNISKNEVAVIQRYLHGWEHSEPDVNLIIDYINALMRDGVYELFTRSVTQLLSDDSKDTRKRIAEYIMQSVVADGLLSENEKWLFAILNNYWELQLPEDIKKQISDLNQEG